jgi:hypothetical protein
MKLFITSRNCGKENKVRFGRKIPEELRHVHRESKKEMLIFSTFNGLKYIRLSHTPAQGSRKDRHGPQAPHQRITFEALQQVYMTQQPELQRKEMRYEGVEVS